MTTPTIDSETIRRFLAASDAQPPAMKRLSRLLLGPGALPDVPTSPHELVLEVIRLHDELQLPRAIREHNAKILAYNIAAGETRDVPEGSRQTAREMIARWLLGDDSGTGAA